MSNKELSDKEVKERIDAFLMWLTAIGIFVFIFLHLPEPIVSGFYAIMEIVFQIILLLFIISLIFWATESLIFYAYKAIKGRKD